jgi:hypothetical protein
VREHQKQIVGRANANRPHDAQPNVGAAGAYAFDAARSAGVDAGCW